jgi:diguanylate cyclase (GGDEF)-like protein
MRSRLGTFRDAPSKSASFPGTPIAETRVEDGAGPERETTHYGEAKHAHRGYVSLAMVDHTEQPQSGAAICRETSTGAEARVRRTPAPGHARGLATVEESVSGARAPAAPSPPVAAEISTVLVIGDLTVASGITQGLLESGFAPVCLRGADDAWRFVLDLIPAAILLGPCPGVDRYAMVRRLRTQDRLAFVPVFFFARPGERGAVGRGIAAGADDVFEPVRDPEWPSEVAERIIARIARSRSLSQLALLDPLTALHNRRFMNERLSAEIARARRSSTDLSMSLIDLDQFKAINDAFGHRAGDRVLVAFARALRGGARSYDVLCRYGGDEFVLLLPGCDASGARAVCAQLRARHAWDLPDLPVISFSAGIAQFPDDGASWADLFGVADANLRRAKEAGRDRIVGLDRPTGS